MGSFAMLLPSIMHVLANMGYSASLSTPILAAYSVAQFIAGPQWGRLSDQKGRKKILYSAMFMGSLAYLSMSLFGSNVIVLFITMAWAGLCGGAMAVIVAAVADMTTTETRTKGMGMVGASIGMAFVCGTAVGGAIAGETTATATIVAPATAASIACLTGALAVFFFFKESRKADISIIENDAGKNAAPAVLAGRLDAFRKIARHSTLLKLCFLILGFTFCLALLESIVPIYTKDLFSWGPPELGRVFVFVGIIMVVVQGGLVGPLASRFGERKLVGTGLALMASGLLLLATLPSPAYLYLSLSVTFVGAALFTASSMSLASHEAEDHEKGAILGVVQSMQSLGRSVGPMVAGLMYDYHQATPFLTGGMLVLCLLFIFIRLTRQFHADDKVA